MPDSSRSTPDASTSDAPATESESETLEAVSAKPQKLLSLRQLWPYLSPYRKQMALALLLLIIGSIAILSIPLLFRDLIDHGFSAGVALPDNIGQIFLLMLVVALLMAASTAGRFYLVSWIGERLTADLRSAIYRRMLTQSPAYFETTRTGEVLARLTGDATLVQTLVGSSISMGLRSGFQCIGGLVMLAVTGLKLFAITLVLLILVVAPLVFVSRRVRKLSRESQDRIADTSAVAGEILNAMPTVQAFARESFESERFDQSVERSFDSAIRRTVFRAVLSASLIAGVFSAIIFVLWLGAHAVSDGSMSPGQLTAFVFYALITAGGVGVISEVWGDAMRAAGATERLIELLMAEPDIRSPEKPQSLTPQSDESGPARLSFEAVEFYYPSQPKTAALAAISLDIEEGETVALVGPSGAGKTTMFQLLLRFYEASGGSIKFNGIDIRELALDDLRSHIGIVPQDAVIFSADAMDNIRYGNIDADDQAVIQAARTALADEFITRLPKGYKTFLGERGVRLSGGQRQRLSIARAILKNPPLLLLDEATSALDAESEVLVQRGLDAAMRDRTTLIIAHRLATVQRADRIVVIEAGRIVQVGSPAELKKSDGLYSRLAQLQLTA